MAQTGLRTVHRFVIVAFLTVIVQCVLFIYLSNTFVLTEKQVTSAHSIESPDETREWRKRLSFNIFALLSLNLSLMVVSISLALKVMRRMSAISDNASRFAKGDYLLPPAPGADDVARVDQLFFEMAHSLIGIKAKLSRDEASLRALLDTIPVGLLVVNKFGCVEIINNTLKNTFGLKKKKLVGKRIDKLFPRLDWESLPLQELIASRATRIIEGNKSGNEDRLIDVEVSFRELRMPEGRRVLLAIQDITKRRELEQMKQDFVAMVTHDLKTPLTSISLFHQLLRNNAFGALPDTAKQPLESAERSLKRLLNLVNGLLDLEKVTAGQLQLNLAPVKLSTIVERSEESVRAFARERQVTIEKPILDTELIADEERLIQVLVNLLSNAIKFSDQGSSVIIEAKSDSDWIEIAVEDSGKGIAPLQQDVIFEKYKQANPSDPEAKLGTGLGLPICKGIISQHRGTIGVESALGTGSRFWIRIPTPI